MTVTENRRPASLEPISDMGRAATTAAVGLGVGVATALLQQVVQPPWFSLVNAASPWLTPMFLVGALWRGRRAAMVAGLATGLFELFAYYATVVSQHYPYLGGRFIVFWFACALVGGPVFGAAGRAWWLRRPAGIGAAALSAAWCAEALALYARRLDAPWTAGLFGAIGVFLGVALGWRHVQLRATFGWFLVAFPAAVLAEMLLGLAYRQLV